MFELVLVLASLVGALTLLSALLYLALGARSPSNLELQMSQRTKTEPRNVQRPPDYLECRAGTLTGQRFNLDAEGFTTIGRNHNNRIQIPEGSVSRFHAQIVVRGNQFVLQDLDSANGTFLNGERVAQALLTDGDEIQIGPCVFIYTPKDVPVTPRRRAEKVPLRIQELCAGFQFEDYRILRQVASGAVATVYEAEDLTNRTRVAIKILQETDPYFRQKFAREGNEVADLLTPGHPNIVRVYRTGTLGEHQSYIVMEFVTGKSLRHELAVRTHFTEEETLPIALQASDALAFAHKRGVVHRDLKPEHFLIDKANTLKIIDFGIARLMSDRTETSAGWIVGTPWYLSPEQARGDRIDGRSDIYSLGIVLYEMLTGAPPFEGSAKEVIQKHLTQDPLPITDRNPAVSRAVESLILCAMARNPQERFQTAAEMYQRLTELLRADLAEKEKVESLDENGNPQARLRFLEGGETPSPIFVQEQYTLGRQELDPFDKSISRHHAQIYRLRDGYWIEDQGSINGTFLNGERIHGPVMLQSGDTINIGNVLLLFEEL